MSTSTAPGPATDSAAQAAKAWEEGVAVALNHAIRNPDGITLRLEHLDGRPWRNPYASQEEALQRTFEPPAEVADFARELVTVIYAESHQASRESLEPCDEKLIEEIARRICPMLVEDRAAQAASQ